MRFGDFIQLIIIIGVPILVLYMIGKFILKIVKMITSSRKEKATPVSINFDQAFSASRTTPVDEKGKPVFSCDRCGAPAKDGATYCTYCGALLNSNYFKNEELARQKEQIQLEHKKIEADKQKHKERYDFFYIVFLLLLPIGLFLILKSIW